ncbi:MAG TPA: biotin--[acetyl-CoA-carboxylase] ligase [Vicinamibacterales bacterium]|nr:biotin--[acetyl-CoA-carboxylase] ligase [Vicinamibacterales bacterium]
MSSVLPAELQSAIEMAHGRLGGFDRIEYFPEVASTNDLALARAARGAPHGTVVVADAQNAGRGRLGRVWHSPPEAGLYLSAVLRAESWEGTLSLVTLAAGVAVVKGLGAATGLVPELKWPNDVVVGRPWRKLAGILSETVSAASQVDAVVVGIGINVRAGAYPPELGHRATAIEVELGRAVDRWGCAVEVLAALSEAASRLSKGDRAWVAADWRSCGAAGLRGSPVRWQDGNQTRFGTAVDIDESGALIIDVAGGRERVISGEVFWERLNS